MFSHEEHTVIIIPSAGVSTEFLYISSISVRSTLINALKIPAQCFPMLGDEINRPEKQTTRLQKIKTFLENMQKHF